MSVYHVLFIQLLVEGDLGCLQFMLMTNKAALNIHLLVFVCEQISFLLSGFMVIPCLQETASFLKHQYHFVFPPWCMEIPEGVHSLTGTQYWWGRGVGSDDYSFAMLFLFIFITLGVWLISWFFISLSLITDDIFSHSSCRSLKAKC